MTEISIVIPVYNSEESLFELGRRIVDALKGYDYELILVNDCSTDNSWQKIIELTDADPHVKGINLRKNFGQDNALMAGFHHSCGKYIVVMDDDLQHSPSDVLKLYDKCKEGYDICYANFSHKQQALWKNIGSYLNGKIAEILIKKPKNIYLSPFKVIKSEVIREVKHYDGPYPYIQGLLLHITNNIGQITVEHQKRYRGKSNFNFFRSLYVFLNLITTFSIIPLRFSAILGIITSLTGFTAVPFYIVGYFQGNHRFYGWTTIVLLLLIIGGMILFCLGVIGEYLGRMYMKVNNNPQFIIKEIVENSGDGQR
jgi:polyisoprenyl-phosphate glycosyltransferase